MARPVKPTLAESANTVASILGTIVQMSDDVKKALTSLDAQGKLLRLQNSIQTSAARIAPYIKVVLDEVKAEREASFQARVDVWIQHCFGPEIGADKVERNHRFLEEALETVQAGGCTASEAHQLVDYVFNRPVGELAQEVGGAMNTLAALCTAHGVNMADAAEVELRRVWTISDKIRAKQAAKPKHSPLPG